MVGSAGEKQSSNKQANSEWSGKTTDGEEEEIKVALAGEKQSANKQADSGWGCGDYR